jgi:hypothetical protein
MAEGDDPRLGSANCLTVKTHPLPTVKGTPRVMGSLLTQVDDIWEASWSINKKSAAIGTISCSFPPHDALGAQPNRKGH